MITAFCGFAGSGKTTASDYLVHTKGYKKVNFKDALVAEMKDRLGSVFEQMILVLEKQNYNGIEAMTVDWLFQNKPPLMRALMQAYGTDIRRRDNPTYWTDQWKESAREALRNGYSIVTDDCRFLNEAQAVKELGGKIIRIARDDITEAGTHVSEVEQLQIEHDTVISCSKGEQELLYSMINEFISEYGG